MIEVKEIEKLLSKDDFVVCNVKGDSMRPFLKEDDKVVIVKKNRDIKMYDVVLYKRNNKYMLHRVIGINRDFLIIRGDNNIYKEEVKNEDILGILAGYYNKNEYIEINDYINRKYYKKSKNTLFLRKIIKKITK